LPTADAQYLGFAPHSGVALPGQTNPLSPACKKRFFKKARGSRSECTWGLIDGAQLSRGAKNRDNALGVQKRSRR